MPDFVPLIRADAIVPGDAKVFTVDGRDVAVFNVGGTFYAIEDTCPHQGAPLHEGWVDAGCVTCPWHAWSFELATGKMTLGDYSSVDTYAVRVESGMLYVSRAPNPEPAS